MARNWQIFELSSSLIIISLFIALLLLNIFNNHSYYYRHKEQESKKLWPKLRQNNGNLDYSVREPLTDEFLKDVQTNLPNLPIEYFHRHSNKVMEKSKDCAQYPAVHVLNFYNTYWQTLYANNSIYQLYGAYYDERLGIGPVIRILAMSNKKVYKVPVIYCQLWFEDDNRPVFSKVQEYQLIWDRNWGLSKGVYYPYLMTCEMPKNVNITGNPMPKVVNLVAQECDTAKNSLRIIYDKPAKKETKETFKMAVCVKGLDFLYEDLSARLIEWLELLRILGADKVFMYNLQVHANISKVLHYYQDKDFVEVQNTTLVGGVVGQPDLEHWLIKGYKLNKRLNEIIPYNDCFYRNMYKYDFIALLDIDEIIMPKGDLRTWQDVIAKTKPSEKSLNCDAGFASVCFRNVYFPAKLPYQELPSLGNYPSHMHILNHAYRLREYTANHEHVKCLHNTQHVLTLHNHYPLTYANNSCRPLDLNILYAQLQHYREAAEIDKEEEVDRRHKFVRDDSVDRFHKSLIKSCTKVLKDLKFIN